MAAWVTAGSRAAFAAVIQLAGPLSEIRAMPLLSPAGLGPDAINPNHALPRPSVVIGVLIMTVRANASVCASKRSIP